MTPPIVSAERVVWRADDAYFGSAKSIYLEPAALSDGIKLGQQDLARANASIAYGTKKLKKMEITNQKEAADLIVWPTIKWWRANKQTVSGRYETRTYEDDIYEPGHYDINGKWIEGRSMKVKRQIPMWIPPSSYYVHLLGIDYAVYDKNGTKVYEINYDKESSACDNYTLLQRSAKDFFDELSDLKKDDMKKGPSIKTRISEILQQEKIPPTEKNAA